MKDIRDSMNLIYGGKIVSTRTKFSKETTKGQVAYCYKGEHKYEVVYSELNSKDAEDRLEVHEYGHIYLGHLDGLEYLSDSLLRIINDRFDDIVALVNKNCGIDFGDKLLIQVRDDPMINHMIHNIAMDCEINSKILDRKDIAIIEKSVFETYGGLSRMDVMTKFCHPSARWGFPNELTYPDYLELIMLNLDKFVKYIMLLKYGIGSPQQGQSNQSQSGQGQQGQQSRQGYSKDSTDRWGSGDSQGQRSKSSGQQQQQQSQSGSGGQSGDQQEGSGDQQGSSGGQEQSSKGSQPGSQSGQPSNSPGQTSGSESSDESQGGSKSGDKSGESSSSQQGSSDGSGGSFDPSDPDGSPSGSGGSFEKYNGQGKSSGEEGSESESNDGSESDESPESITDEQAELLNDQEYVNKRYEELKNMLENPEDISKAVSDISGEEGGTSDGSDGEIKGRKSDHGSDSREKVHVGEVYSKGGSGRGTGRSTSTRSFIKDLDPIDIGLEEVVRSFRKKVIKRSYSRNLTYKYNRRIITDVISPSYTMKITSDFDPTILFIIDVSGSMDTSLVDRVINTIRRKMRMINSNLKYSILTWDTSFCELYKDLNTKKNTPKISCGGGTCLAKSFIYAKEKFSDDTIIVVISDFEDNLGDWEVAMSKMKSYTIYGFNYGYPQDQKNFKCMKVKNCNENRRRGGW